MNNLKSTLREWMQSLGPGIITAALVFGPGSLTLASKIGSLYAYHLLWVGVVATFFMIVFTRMAARIGLANEESLLSIIRNKWGKTASAMLGISVFLVVASFQAGNSIGVGLAFGELYGTPSPPWIIGITLLGIGLLFFSSFYKILEKVMMILVGIMLVAFVGTLLMVEPDIGGILSGLLPRVPDGSEVLIIAFVASSLSIVGAFYQSYLVQERGWKKGHLQKATRDSTVGIILLGLIGTMVVISAAAVLYTQSIEVRSATDMAKALEPLLGRQARALFMYGLFGASFSSLIGNATIGGSLLGDALGFKSQLHSLRVRLLIALIMVLGATIAIVFGKLPLELIVFAQSITILIVPFIGIAILAVANDGQRMGTLKNTVIQNTLGSIGLLILLILAVANARSLFSNTINCNSMSFDVEDLLKPYERLVAELATLDGDLLILGAGGKIGPSIARLARAALDQAGVSKKVIGVSRFSEEGLAAQLNKENIDTISADILDDEQLQALPLVKNVLYLAGTKFGTTNRESYTWAMNTYLPGRVAEKYKDSRIVVYSTGNVYPFTPVLSGGATEETRPEPVGEYGQSCLGRERMFQHFSSQYNTPLLIYRLNYAIDFRYGVLLEVAKSVLAQRPIDLTMGHVNVIWQGDANEMALRSLLHCEVPSRILNITGPETVSLRWLAHEFGKIFGTTPEFINEEQPTALLSNAAESFRLFGYPRVTLKQMIELTADWLLSGGETINKPTHFQERKGQF